MAKLLECSRNDSPNLGLLFYKSTARQLHDNDNYKQVSGEFIDCLEQRSIGQYQSPTLETKAAFSQTTEITEIKLTTNYLGLVAGLGYSHSTGESDEEIKLGFSFDFTSGLPYIPGSSVKGRLRSFFPSRYENVKKRTEVTTYLHSIFKELKADGKITSNVPTELEVFKEWAKKLECLLFEGKDLKGNRILSPLQQDTFFDAFPIAAEQGKFIGTDTITPHAHPLKDPLPLRLLKILPGVTICFQFRLNSEGGLTAKEKKALFSFLLLRHGAGAKTRSGFGQFVDGEALSAWRKNLKDNDGFLDLKPLPGSSEKSSEPKTTQIVLKTDEALAEYIGKDSRNPKIKLFRIIEPANSDKEEIVPFSFFSEISPNKRVIFKIEERDKKTKIIKSVSNPRWID